MRVGNLTDNANIVIRYPLRERGIGIAGVLKIVLDNDLLPRFPAFMARGGCKGCFYKRDGEVMAMHFLAPNVLDELQALEEEVQDERGEFFYMFSNLGMSIRKKRAYWDANPMMFSLDQVYHDASQTGDKGAACGLFCHR